MSFTVAMLKQMRAEGLSFDAAIRVLEAGTPARSSGAERQARYRARNVTRDVTPSPNERDNLTPTRETKTEAKASSKSSIFEEKKRAISSCLRAAFPEPDGVSAEQWSAFRSQRKKALNLRSYTLLCNKLTTLAEAGWPPGDMIDLAIERGWETVFEPRTPQNGQSASNVTSLRGHRPDPALDLLRAARAAEDREDRWGAGPSLPTIGTG